MLLQHPGRIWCLVFLLALVPLSMAAAVQTIVLEGDVWAPYVMDPKAGAPGFMVELAEEALTRAGYRVEFRVTPWTRALTDMQTGEATAVVGIYFSQAAQRNYLVPSEELGISINQFFVSAPSVWRYSNPSSLKGLVLATIADYDYGDLDPYIDAAVQDHSPWVQVMFGNDALEKNLKKLVTGRVDAVIEDRVVVAFVAGRLKLLDQIHSAGAVGPENRAGVAFSPKDPLAAQYVRALSEGIKKLRLSGELKRVLDKYGVADWK